MVKTKQFLVVIYSWALKTRKTRTNRLKKTLVVKTKQFLVVIYSWALKTRINASNQLSLQALSTLNPLHLVFNTLLATLENENSVSMNNMLIFERSS